MGTTHGSSPDGVTHTTRTTRHTTCALKTLINRNVRQTILHTSWVSSLLISSWVLSLLTSCAVLALSAIQRHAPGIQSDFNGEFMTPLLRFLNIFVTSKSQGMNLNYVWKLGWPRRGAGITTTWQLHLWSHIVNGCYVVALNSHGVVTILVEKANFQTLRTYLKEVKARASSTLNL